MTQVYTENGSYFEFDEQEREFKEGYDELLNGTNEELFGYSPARILEIVDPEQYHTGLAEYIDSMLDNDGL